MNYSGPLRRIAAFVIDMIAMLGLYVIVGFILSLSFFSAPIFALSMLGFWFYGGMFVLSWIYFSCFESSQYQATIGKKLLGLKVVSLDGKRISFLRATARYFGKILSRMLMMIGFLMIPFNKKKQGLHDKIAGTVVLRNLVK